MSNVNIKRAVENIRANTTVYTPIVEMIVNAIQAIDETGRTDGLVSIRAIRSDQEELEDGLAEILGFEIEDNGIGFTDAHRESFDTLYTDKKISEGGKGFGRFIALKYFENVNVKSIYKDGDYFKERSFSMGKDNEIIVDENISTMDNQLTGSIFKLDTLKKGGPFEKKLSTIARYFVEKLLPYFITKDYVCPKIVLSEYEKDKGICLNDFFNNQLSASIKEIGLEKDNTFILNATNSLETFNVRVFKFYSPKNTRSKISLVAHRREVTGSLIHKYIPEFEDEFFEKNFRGEIDHERNYIIKAYVSGRYLDNNVSLERGDFEFKSDSDLILGISKTEIEHKAANIARECMGIDITCRQEKKYDRVKSFVDDKAPWHKTLLNNIDLSGLGYNASDEEIELRFQKEKFNQEIEIKKSVSKLLAEGKFEDAKERVVEVVNRISDSSKNDLIHYIAMRRTMLDIFSKSLEINSSGKYSSEGTVHDIIFPRKSDTEKTTFENHNLWIIDERLNFTNYVSSDIPLNGGNTERVDLLVYNKRVLFRGDNEESNPITIFEFKKPQRDDFANPSSDEDPIQQIIRYVNSIKEGKYKTPEGRRMNVANNTPFYGYVVCDINTKVENWLEKEKDFKPMPDRLGWFQWRGNINLYIEVISWDKVLKDAKMRNQIFFQKLGI